MESLIAEIDSKRKALTELDGGAEPSKKYRRRADIERAKEDEERRKKSEILAAEKALRDEKRAAKMSKDVRLSDHSLSEYSC